MKASIMVAGLFVAALGASLAWLFLADETAPPPSTTTTANQRTVDSPAAAARPAAPAPTAPAPPVAAVAAKLASLDCSAPSGDVAKVNQVAIPAAAFCEELAALSGTLQPTSPEPMHRQARDLLEQHIDALLVDAALVAEHAEVSPADLDTAMPQLKPALPGTAEPELTPAQQRQVRTQLQRRLGLRKLVDLRGDLAVPAGAAEVEFQSHPERWIQAGVPKIQPYLVQVAPGASKAQHDSARQAAEALAQAVQTQAPEAAAAAHRASVLPAFDLEPGSGEPELQQVVASLAVGAWSKPVLLRGGWAVVRLVSRSAAPPRTFEAVRDEILRTLTAQRRLAEQARILADLRSKASIQVLVAL